MKLTRGRSRQAPGAMDVVSSDTRAQGKKRPQCGPDAAALPPAALKTKDVGGKAVKSGVSLV
jgi:hypothetical protein